MCVFVCLVYVGDDWCGVLFVLGYVLFDFFGVVEGFFVELFGKVFEFVVDDDEWLLDEEWWDVGVYGEVVGGW